MTRACERLFLTNARRRSLYGQEQMNSPSRFLGEIPGELLDREEPAYARPSFYGGTGSSYRPQEPAHNLASIFRAPEQPSAGESFPEVEVVPEEEGVRLGMRVRHGKFGPGTIRKIEGKGDETKVIVWFESVGPKKLLLRFAGLQRG
jgi:DNA helicase II / ATP-dependent DNA helicase PcrA